jgi:hypothetical protein
MNEVEEAQARDREAASKASRPRLAHGTSYSARRRRIIVSIANINRRVRDLLERKEILARALAELERSRGDAAQARADGDVSVGVTVGWREEELGG